jgi:murein DD-endopeptidase MepM/ murein hydrolase activator NlpD
LKPDKWRTFARSVAQAGTRRSCPESCFVQLISRLCDTSVYERYFVTQSPVLCALFHSGARYNEPMWGRVVLSGLYALAVSSITSAADSIGVKVAARSLQPGEAVLLTLTTPSTADSLHVEAFGHDTMAFRVDASTWRALVGIDLGTRAGRYPVSIAAHRGGQQTRTDSALVVSSRNFPTRRLRVDEGFVTPPPEVQRRIAEEAQDLGGLWAHSAPARLWTGPFVRPVQGAATSAFGMRSVYNGTPRTPHGGADFLGPIGTVVGAPNAGRIVMARELYFLGNVVVVDHGLGLFSLLAHLSTIAVHEGETVTATQRIGQVGATGRVTGPHLHWAVRLGGARVDPLSLLALLGSEVAGPGSPTSLR